MNVLAGGPQKPAPQFRGVCACCAGRSCKRLFPARASGDPRRSSLTHESHRPVSFSSTTRAALGSTPSLTELARAHLLFDEETMTERDRMSGALVARAVPQDDA